MAGSQSPDQGIKKVIIPKAELPAVFGPENKYVVRYRFVSEDKNRTSHWSPQYKISPLLIESIQHSTTVSEDKNIITVVWEAVEGISQYDVFASWSEGAWEYVATVGTNTFVSLKRTNASSVKFSIQSPSFPRARYDSSTLFVTNVIDLMV